MLSLLVLCGMLGASQGFLNAALPLEAVNITPGDQDAKNRIAGKQPITVIFSRPLIALGSDWGDETLELPAAQVPFQLVDDEGRSLQHLGRMRFPTTYTARFDPTEDWPTDLVFSAVINPTLQSYDGAKVAKGGPRAMSYFTDSLYLRLSKVEHAGLQDLTDGQWSPFVGRGSHFQGSLPGASYAPEVPEGSLIFLTADQPVHLPSLRQALSIPKAPGSILSVRACPSTSSPSIARIATGGQEGPAEEGNDDGYVTCAVLAVAGFRSNTPYALELPAGARYHPLAGPLRQAISIPFTSVLPFQFMVNERASLSTTRVHLWLRHGLSDDTTLANLARALTVTEAGLASSRPLVEPSSLPFRLLLPNKGKLTVVADFKPERQYTFAFAGTVGIQDGFNQPLLSHSFTWEARPANMFWSEPQGALTFEKGTFTQTQWTVLARGRSTSYNNNNPQTCTVAPIGESSILTALTARAANSVRGLAGSTLTQNVGDTSFQVLSLPIPATPMFWHGSEYGEIVQVTDISASVVHTQHNLVVWATSMSSGLPLPRAKVELYQHWRPRLNYTSGEYLLVGTYYTDLDGVAEIKRPMQRPDTYLLSHSVVVSLAGDMALVDSVGGGYSDFRSTPREALKHALVTDRAVYKPGDEIKLKGYVRSVLGEEVQLGAAGSVVVTVQWTRQPFSNVQPFPNGEPQETPGLFRSKPLSISKDFGTFDTVLTVPADATYGQTSLSLQYATARGTQTISLNTITIADPRRPTASVELSTTAPFYRLTPDAQPGASAGVPVKIKVLTATKRPIANAQVLLRYSFDGALEEVAPEASLLKLTTDANGEVNIVFALEGRVAVDVDAIKGAPQRGINLVFSAEWLGPTGELVRPPDVSLPVAFSDWAVSCEPSVSQPLPGLPFGVYVGVKDRAEVAVRGLAVRVVLRQMDGEFDRDRQVTVFSPGRVLASCDATSDGGDALQCLSFVLPTATLYRLEATALDQLAYTVTQLVVVGQPREQWDRQFLSGWSPTLMRLQPPQGGGLVYPAGEPLSFTMHNPFGEARVLLRWGSKEGYAKRVVSVVEGANTWTITPGEECARACTVFATLAVGRDAATLTQRRLAPDVPVSAQFDFAAPRIATQQFVISVAPPAEELQVLAVAVAVMREEEAVTAVTPGSEVVVEVTLTLDGLPAVGEVAVFAVDEAFLQLRPHPVKDLSAAFEGYAENLHVYMSENDVLQRLAFDHTYTKVVDTFVRRVAVDRWASPTWELGHSPSWYNNRKAEIDETDAQWFERRSQSLTAFPTCMRRECRDPNTAIGGYVLEDTMEKEESVFFEASPMNFMASAPMADGAGGGQADRSVSTTSGGGGAVETADIAPRTNFQTAPLFVGRLVTDKSGKVSVPFTLPDTLGSFNVRVYAVGGTSAFASGEADVVVRKELNLQAMMPRFVRAGDSFEAGVTVGADDADFDEEVTVTAFAPAGSPIALRNGQTSQTTVVRLTGTTPVRVKFEFAGAALGEATLKFAASSPNSAPATASFTPSVHTDALQDEWEVLAVQDPVSVATSMAITASDKGERWSEGIAFPLAVKGSGDLSLTAGVGRFPSVQAFAEPVLPCFKCNYYQTLAKKYTDGQLAVSRCLLAPAFEPYGPFPATTKDQTASVAQRVDLAYPEAVAVLQKHTDETRGLRYSVRKPPHVDERPSVSLNAYGLYLALRMRESSIKGRSIASDLTDTWTEAMTSELHAIIAYQQTNGTPEPQVGERMLAETLLALGPLWRGDTSGGAQPPPATLLQSLKRRLVQTRPEIEPRVEPLSLEWLLTRPALQMRTRLTVGLAYLLRGETGGAFVEELAADLVQNIRLQGRTAYVAAYANSPHPLGSTEQSMALSVLVLSGKSKEAVGQQMVEKVANFVAQGGAASPWGRGDRAQVFAAQALSDYDKSRGSTSPDLLLTVTSANKALLKEAFTSPTQPSVHASFSWGKLPQVSVSKKKGLGSSHVPSSLFFTAQGSGEVSVAASLNFVPLELFGSPVYRGIYVEKSIRRVDPATNEAVGPSLQVVEEGAIVEVTLQITTPDELDNVRLVDLVPGGLEPLDEPEPKPVIPVYYDMMYRPWGMMQPVQQRRSPYTQSWAEFANRETLPDRVRWTADRLNAGAHSVSYRALAVTSGVWSLPPAKAAVAAQPELMGLSAGGQFVVSAGPVGSQFELAAFLKGLGVAQWSPLAPVECEIECAVSEFCNLSTGACEAGSSRSLVADAASEPEPPAGSCAGACGSQSLGGECHCDHFCEAAGDCCSDVVAVCETVLNAAPDSCVGRCTQQAPAGCWCDDECAKLGDCCADRAPTCDEAPAAGVSTMAPAHGSCVDSCQGKSLTVDSTCWCDAACAVGGDCCFDYLDACVVAKVVSGGATTPGAVGTCAGLCGAQAAGCWCDATCTANNDCCSDFGTKCGLQAI